MRQKILLAASLIILAEGAATSKICAYSDLDAVKTQEITTYENENTTDASGGNAAENQDTDSGNDEPGVINPVVTGYQVTETERGLRCTYNGGEQRKVHLTIKRVGNEYTVTPRPLAGSRVYYFDVNGYGKQVTDEKIVAITYKNRVDDFYVKKGRVATAANPYYIVYRNYMYFVRSTGRATKSLPESRTENYRRLVNNVCYNVNYRTARVSVFTGMYHGSCYKAGKPATGWQTCNGKKFYCKKGVPVKGRRKIEGKWYYFNFRGAMATKDITENGVAYYIDKYDNLEAYAKGGSYYKPEGTRMSVTEQEDYITLRTARGIVRRITTSTMSSEQKLKVCFDWVIHFPYNRHRIPFPASNPAWVPLYANDHFLRGGGDCHADAAAFAYLARAIGYTDVYVCLDARLENSSHHAWTMINGLYYDPLFSEAKDYNRYYAASSYELHPIHKQQVGVGYVGEE